MESSLTLIEHHATFAGMIFVITLLLRQHKVWTRVKDRLNTLWHDRCRAKGDDYVPLENGRL
jgi:hypothetical protein